MSSYDDDDFPFSDAAATPSVSRNKRSRAKIVIATAAITIGIGVLCCRDAITRGFSHHHRPSLGFTMTLRRNDKRRRLNQLIEFGVVGFPKCGTSYLLHHLLSTDETYMGGEEHCLASSDPSKKFALYEEGRMMEDGKTSIKNGLKCPRDLQDRHGLDNYEKYLPEMKFIVSIRHPVLWFQSFYNYKLRQHALKKHDTWKPNVSELIGACNEGSPYVTHEYGKHETHREGVCTHGARFHHYLSRLGFTDMDTKQELSLLEHDMSVHSFPDAKLFLMEIGQFSIENKTRAAVFIEDLQQYIGLEGKLPPLTLHTKKELPEDVESQFINICDEQYDFVRSILVETGRDAHRWIRDYLIKSQQVVVSSPEHFLELIEAWERDPCLDEEA